MNKILFVTKKIYLVVLVLTALIICSGSVGFSSFALIAFGFYVSLTLIFLSITRKYSLSLVLTSSLVICLQLINQLKVHFYKERLFFSDLYVAFDPKNFATLLHYPQALLCLIALLLFIVINVLFFRRAKKVSSPMRLIYFFIACGLLTMIIYISKQPQLNKLWQQSLPKGRGTISNLFVSSNQFAYEPPFYDTSSDYFLQKLSSIENKITPANSAIKHKPDVVVFLQESTVNPQLFDVSSENLPHFEMFSQKNSNLMRVQTFGGGTWLTEFSMLTGLNTNDFSYRKNAVYYVVAPHIKTSLFNEFNNNEYLTVVLSPMGYGNYNAGAAYTAFGMQKFLMPQDLGYAADKTENLWKIPTQDIINEVKTILETYTDKPLFIFVLSMFEHGPYHADYPDSYHIDKDINNPEIAGKLNDYLARIAQLNTATKDFSNYIKQREKPTLFLYFGDHQPALGWNRGYKTDLTQADYLTQYTLLANYPIDFEHNQLTDTSLVSGLILEKAQIQYSDFYKANIAMRYLCSGKLDDCEDKKLVESYKHYIYQDLQNAGQATKP